MYIQAFLQKKTSKPCGNSPSVSLARSLLSSILHKRRRNKKCEHLCVSHHNSQPLLQAVEAKSFLQALACQGDLGINVWAGYSDKQWGHLPKNMHPSLWGQLVSNKMENDKRKKKFCLCNGEKWIDPDSWRYCKNNLDSQHLQMNKLQKHFPLMLNEL